MILKKVTIANFLSITGSIEVDLDRRATILLGANDHGKSNILKAVLCMNEDTPILAADANWDATEDAALKFEFELSKPEGSALVDAARQDASDPQKQAAGAALSPSRNKC